MKSVFFILMFFLLNFIPSCSYEDIFTPVKEGNIEGVREMLDKNPELVKEKDAENSSTPLHWAVYEDNEDLVKLLIEKGADVNAKNIYECTPLHYAVENFNMRIVKLLLSKGADVTVKNKKGKTPVDIAEENEDEDMVYLLDVKDYDDEKTLELRAESEKLREEKKYEEALKTCDEALKYALPSRQFYIWMTKGYVYRDMGDYENAIECYNHANSSYTSYVSISAGLDQYYDFARAKGEALYELGRYEEALKYYDYLSAEGPGYTYKRSLILAKLGKYGEAKEDLHMSDVSENERFIVEGYILLGEGKYEEAIELFNKVLETEPGNREAKEGKEKAEKNTN